MDWEKLLARRRLRAQEGSAEKPQRTGRTEFESDIDRVTFSSSFRRLGRKTQVHPMAANDHVHTRLTHSLEVSRVGRALGKSLGVELLGAQDRYCPALPSSFTSDDIGSIVQAACLAHDLGNPPFGHAGEEAIIHWFDQNHEILPQHLQGELRRDLCSLEGNAQGFRILTQLENHIFDGGLRLTYATLGAFQKYPWSSRSGKKKFGAYISEEHILDLVFEELGVEKQGDGSWSRHPLAYLMEAADDICYAVLDIEDAVELKIIPYGEAQTALLSVLSEAEAREVKSKLELSSMHRVNFARIRGPIFDRLIVGSIASFLRNYAGIMSGSCNGSLFDLLPEEDRCRKFISDAKRLGRESIYVDTKKVEIEIGCYSTFDTLLSEFCAAARDQGYVLNDDRGESRVGWKSQQVLRLMGDHAPSKNNAPQGGWSSYQCMRRAIDFVSGMTDNYATYIAKQLQGGGFSGGQRP